MTTPLKPSAQPLNIIQLERVIENPTQENLTPEVIQQLQTLRGNAFVTALVLQSRQNTSPQPTSKPIQRWQNAAPSKTNAPTFSNITSDKITMLEKLRGLKKAKKTVQKPPQLVQQIAGGNQAQTREETPSEHGAIISENATTVANAMSSGNFNLAMVGLQALAGIFGQYLGLAKTVFKFLAGIKKTIKNFSTRKALQKTVKLLKAKVEDGSASANEQSVYDSAAYGLSKVTRRFAFGIANTVIALGKAISTWVTFFTGGTTLVFTSIGDLLTKSAKGVIKGYRAGKALYKERKGIKGVNRAQNAQTLVESAYNNQSEALSLMLKLKVGKKVFASLKEQGKVSGKYPKTLTEMTLFLRKLKMLNGNEFDLLRDDLKKQLSS